MNETFEVRIRVAELGDQDVILQLVPEVSERGRPSWRNPEHMVATDRQVITASLAGETPESQVLVAENGNGAVVGFIHLCQEQDYYQQGPCGHIADLVVAAGVRGKGVGRRLIAKGEDWARERGYSMLTLNVFIGNAEARELYSRAGFNAETVRYVKPLV
jgi:GNAT superfamily N-acetyltransferase